jgi:hypothetical protein
MNTLALNVQELNLKELDEFNGGGLFSDLAKKLTPIAIGIYIIENWADIKSGLSDGWTENH